MAEQDVRPVSASTGQFAVLKLDPPHKAPVGNSVPLQGRELPQVENPGLEILTRKLNIASRSLGRDLRFQVNLESGRSVIQVLDHETGELIRQIPPEKAKAYVSDQGDVTIQLFDEVV